MAEKINPSDYSPPNVNYWGDRCCKAEAEVERLKDDVVKLETETLNQQIVIGELRKGWNVERDAEIERLKAALTAVVEHHECHPAACRDEQLWRDTITAAIAAEREACAQVAEVMGRGVGPERQAASKYIAAALRALKHEP